MISLDEERVKDDVARVREMIEEVTGMGPLPLDPLLVPENLRDLAPMAELFGNGNSVAWLRALEMMPAPFLSDLCRVVDERRDAIQGWLDEASGSNWSDERLGFADLLRAVDYVRL
jgi:hypothetical protein